MSGKSNRKNKKKKIPVDMSTVYIDWQRKAIADAYTSVNMADAGRMTDRESRIYLDAMEFTLIFGWYLGTNN